MSTLSTAIANPCKNCASELAAEALVCKRCHTLVHAAELQQISAGAKMFEEHGEPKKALEAWQRALTLIPDDAEQKKWVRDKIRNLEAAAAVATEKQNAWAKKLGPLAPIAVLLAKSKFLLTLFKLKSLLSLATFVAFYWTLFGMKFGIGFAVLILMHEMGHYIDIKRRGLPAEMPMFLPGFGAYVKWAAMGVSLATQAAVSLAGPLAGLLGAAVCALLWWQTGNGLWAALASSSAILNALNLTPVWVLDGGKAIAALDKTERIVILAAALILCFAFDEKIFLLVAAGATYRLFTKDLPPQPSRSTLAYFLVVMAGLGLILYVLPAQAIGPR
ncbi:MAG TPA: site-2 protease family protein [Candidatus Acidoferrum sp.]